MQKMKVFYVIKTTDKLPFLRVVYREIYIEETIENFKTRLISRSHPEQT